MRGGKGVLPDVGCVIVGNRLRTFENEDAEEATGVTPPPPPPPPSPHPPHLRIIVVIMLRMRCNCFMSIFGANF
jgi:hypothetical protein